MKGGRSVYDPHFAVRAAFGCGDERWKEKFGEGKWAENVYSKLEIVALCCYLVDGWTHHSGVVVKDVKFFLLACKRLYRGLDRLQVRKVKFQEVGVFACFLPQILDGLLGLFLAPYSNVDFGIVCK